MKAHKNFLRTILAFSQAILDVIIYWLSFSIVIYLWLNRDPAGLTFEVQAFFTGTMLAVFWFNSLYEFKNWTFWDETKIVLKASLLILLVAVLYLYSQKFDLSRFFLVVGILIFVPLCLISRYLFRRIFFALGLLRTNIIILGAGKTGEIFAEKIIAHTFTSCKVAGFLDDDPNKQGKIIAGFRVLGKLDDFIEIYDEYDIDEAAVAISTASRKLLTHILDLVEFHVRQVHYIPDMYMLTTFSASIRDVDGMPLISASQGLLNPVNRFAKNIIDYTGAFAALIIFSPVMIWAALRIKHEDGGKIFHSLATKGRHGEIFKCYSFRTHKLKRAGKFLRRTRINRLPQLFNVLKGEMSLVGPAPSALNSKIIYTVKPGITGFLQVSVQNRVDSEIRREMNSYYIRNWSIWLDIVIILRTIYALFNKK